MVVIVGGYLLTVGRMNSAKHNDLNSLIASEIGKIESYNVAMNSIDGQLKEFQDISKTLSGYGQAGTGENEIVYLYQSIDSICSLPGYKLEEITPSLGEIIQFLREWKGAEAMVYIPIKIRINGRYRSLAKLVESVEASGYFSKIEYCRLTGSKEQYPDCEMDFKFMAGLTNRMGMVDFE